MKEKIIEKVTKLNYKPKVKRLTDEQKEYVLWMFRKALQDYEDEILGALIGNSTHGNCCTCEKCKNFHDDCMCQAIERIKQKIKSK